MPDGATMGLAIDTSLSIDTEVGIGFLLHARQDRAKVGVTTDELRVMAGTLGMDPAVGRSITQVLERLDRFFDGQRGAEDIVEDVIERLTGEDRFLDYADRGYVPGVGKDREDWPDSIPVGMSLIQQREWWQHLSLRERSYYATRYARALLMLKGLPADGRQLAEACVDYKDYERLIESAKVTLELDLKVLHAGIACSYERTAYADGSVKIDLAVSAELGKEYGSETGGSSGSVSASLAGSSTLMYTFDSKKDADDFLDGLMEALRPATSSYVLAPTDVPAELYQQVSAHLHRSRDHLDDWRVDVSAIGSAEGSGGAAGNKGTLSVSAAIGGDYSILHGDATVHVETTVSGSVEFAAGEVAEAEASVKGTLHFDEDLHVEHVTLALGGEASAGVDVLKAFGAPPSIHATVIAGMRVDVVVDVPVGSRLAGDLVERLREGEPLDLAALHALAGKAEITATVSAVSERRYGFDAEVVQGEVSQKETTSIVTYQYIPGAGWAVADPAACEAGRT